jgi:hypothetical protein
MLYYDRNWFIWYALPSQKNKFSREIAPLRNPKQTKESSRVSIDKKFEKKTKKLSRIRRPNNLKEAHN